MEFWLEKRECTGCGACSNICPQNAITMEEDECGFLYPEIGLDCIDCGICKKICEGRLKLEKAHAEIPATYAAWSKDEDIRYASTSGGVFSEIARGILNSGGYVVGAAYNNENLVEHIVIHSEDGLRKIRQSKYVQSNMGNVYREVKRLLCEGRTVAFCGAPCQIAGLVSFLGKEHKNLLLLDFICLGVNSPKAFLSWLNEIKLRERKEKVARIWFKYKQEGWKRSPYCTRVDFNDGSYEIYSQEANSYMKGYLSYKLYLRPCCGDCQFKGVPRLSDITLADFWGIEKELDDDKGTSMVLVNSEKGRLYFEATSKRLIVHKRNMKDVISGNPCFQNSVDINRNSEAFLKSLDNMPFSKALSRYGKEPLYRRAKRRLQSVRRKITKGQMPWI